MPISRNIARYADESASYEFTRVPSQSNRTPRTRWIFFGTVFIQSSRVFSVRRHALRSAKIRRKLRMRGVIARKGEVRGPEAKSQIYGARKREGIESSRSNFTSAKDAAMPNQPGVAAGSMRRTRACVAR